MEGFCVRCKSKREMINIVKDKTKKNQNMIKGNCKSCNNKICRFVKKDSE
jgi:hypothetical protein